MYLPLAAIVVALALLMRRLGARTAAIAGAGLVALWGGLTVWRNHDYRSSVAIWEQTVRYQPNNERAHNNLGQILLQRGRLDDAIAHFEAAIAKRPGFPDAHNNLGLAFFQKGDWDRAVKEYERAIEARPAAPGPVHAEYGPRRTAGGPRIEPQRIAPQARTSEEEQLEIPAFLRRQAN